MTDANGIFVKIFRNKEVWNQNEDLFKIEMGKAESEIEYRKKLAAEAGLESTRIGLGYNQHIDAKLFYPEFDCDSSEFSAWCGGAAEKNHRGSTKETIEEFDRVLGWPTEVLEEMALFHKFQIFESYTYFNSTVGSTTPRSRLIYGRRGEKRYLIAWLGEKIYYDQIQSQLAEIEDQRNNPAPCQAMPENTKPEETVRDHTITALTLAAVLIWLCVGWISYINFFLPESGSGTDSAKSTSLDESKICGATGKSEHLIEYNTIESLPAGTVVEKWVPPSCSFCREISIRFSLESFRVFWVSRDVFDQLKIGDELPFKKPERKEF